MGAGAVQSIISERDENGPYQSIEDLCRRADLCNINKRVMESLIKAGALDSLGERGTLLANIASIMSLAQREQKLKDTGQSTMFDMWGETVNTPMPGLEMESAEVSLKERLNWEKELLGIYLSEHPFSPYVAKAAAENTTLCGQVDSDMEGQTVAVAGMVDSVHSLTTRDGQPSASVTLEDLDGKLEVMAWSRVYAATREFWEEGNILLVDGKVRLRGDRVQLVCDHVRHYRLDESTERENTADNMNKPVLPPVTAANAKYEKTAGKRRLTIRLRHSDDEAADITSFRSVVGILHDYPGDDEVRLVVDNTKKVYKLKLPGVCVDYNPELHRRLVSIVGAGRRKGGGITAT